MKPVVGMKIKLIEGASIRVHKVRASERTVFFSDDNLVFEIVTTYPFITIETWYRGFCWYANYPHLSDFEPVKLGKLKIKDLLAEH